MSGSTVWQNVVISQRFQSASKAATLKVSPGGGTDAWLMKHVIDGRLTQRTGFSKNPVASWGCYVHGVQTMRQGSRHNARKLSHRRGSRREGRSCYLHSNCMHGIRMNYSVLSCMQNSSIVFILSYSWEFILIHDLRYHISQLSQQTVSHDQVTLSSHMQHRHIDGWGSGSHSTSPLSN